MKTLILILLCLTGSSLATTNSSLASIGDSIVTTRDVETHYMVVHMLNHFKLPLKALPMKSSQLAQSGSSYLLELMVFKEAKEFKLAPITSREIKRAGTRVLARLLKSPAAKHWKSWQVETDELDRLIEINLRSRKLIGDKRRAAEVLVTEAEIDTYVKANVKDTADVDSKLVRSRVKSFLGQKQGEQRLREWFQVLKDKYKIRVF